MSESALRPHGLRMIGSELQLQALRSLLQQRRAGRRIAYAVQGLAQSLTRDGQLITLIV